MTNGLSDTGEHQSPFQSAKHIDEHGREFWHARDLALILGYSEFRHFLPVIEKAKTACELSGHQASDHIEEFLDMIPVGKGANRPAQNFRLSRYACYLIIQNSDPSKPVVAHGQTYFAVQTRRQELADDQRFAQLTENEKRLALRRELATHNSALADAARGAGVEGDLDYAIFQNHGYMGLYGGLDAKSIHARKRLKKSHKILDHMGSTELAANLFRATQTEEKLRREQVSGKHVANRTHFEVGAKVRKTIEELGGTMPENLPTPEKSIQKIESERRKAFAPPKTVKKTDV